MMKSDTRWRAVIALSTVLLIVLAFVMICLTAPRMLVGIVPAESVELVVTPIADASDSVVSVNINTASAEELMQVPGMGRVLADRIVSYRAYCGRFDSVEELNEIVGIGSSRIAQWRDYLVVR